MRGTFSILSLLKGCTREPISITRDTTEDTGAGNNVCSFMMYFPSEVRFQDDRQGHPYYIRSSTPPRVMHSIAPCIVGMTLAVILGVGVASGPIRALHGSCLTWGGVWPHTRPTWILFDA